MDVQQRTGLKNALLQKRLQTLSELSEHKDLRIAEMAAAADPTSTIATKCIEVRLCNKVNKYC